MKEKARVLLQYSGEKDSTACWIKLKEKGYTFEAIHFVHDYRIDLKISRYFNQAVELPENISIFRPLIYYTNDDVFAYLKEYHVSIKRNNDTGDKYFEYSKKGCPLQFKDYGAPYTKEMMLLLKKMNTI